MNKIFSDNSANSMFLRFGIEDALVATKPFTAGNKKMADSFFAEVISWVQKFSCPKNPFYKASVTVIKNAFGTYGVHNGTELVAVLMEDRDVFIKGEKWPQMKNIKKIKAAAKPKGPKIKSYDSDEGLDPERTIAIRSQYGGYDVKFYKFTGSIGKDNMHQLNMLKLEYHYETKCPYYQARPILLSTWQKLDDAHKQASRIWDTSED